jgi:Cu-Zn family superoxide dismutase
MNARLLAVPLVALGTLVAGCAGDDAEVPPADTEPIVEPVSEEYASAQIASLGDSEVNGLVSFESTDSGLQVTYELNGLPPGMHGFHVHENGSCDPGDDGEPGGAAGGHFNPTGAPHGAPAAAADQRHIGDFGNIEAGADGRAAGTFTDAVAMLDGAAGIVGKALVVHGNPDDLATQPTGDAGSRIGCGIITMTDGSAMPPADTMAVDTMQTAMR